MPFPETTLFRRSATPVETTVGSEIVLMSLESGNCFGLGETGSDVWRLLAEPSTVSTLVTHLRETYDAPPGTIESDVAELLQTLHGMNLVEPA